MVGFAVTALDRDIADKRFLHRIAAEIAISQPVHEVEFEVIKIISGERWCRLRDAIEMIARVGVVDTRRDTPSLEMMTFGQPNRRRTAPCNRHPSRGEPVGTGGVRPMTNAASPAGGGVRLSRSDGRNPYWGLPQYLFRSA